MFVYLIKHQQSGKCYVGQTIRRPMRRFKMHVSAASNPATKNKQVITRAIALHGADAFSFEVLETCVDKESLDAAERKWIEHHGSRAPQGYNVELGGSLNKVISPETRAKISASKLGKARDAVTRAKISAAHLGKKLSPESIEKRSAHQRGKPLSAEHRAALSAAHTGHRHTAESRAKMSTQRKGKRQGGRRRAEAAT